MASAAPQSRDSEQAAGPGSDRIIFGIPLIAKAVAQDWDRTLQQLCATLGSLYRQTSENFRILLAGSDELGPVDVDGRFEFLPYPAPRSTAYDVVYADMTGRRRRIAERARETGGGCLMFVDADDLISAHLAAFFTENPHPNGYIASAGYVFDALSGEIAPYPLPDYKNFPFHRICGTSAIVRLRPDELPEASGQPTLYDHIFGEGHAYVQRNAARLGRPLAELPFRAVAYTRTVGESMSFRADAADASRRFHIELARRIPAHAIERTPRLTREFNLTAAKLR